MKGVVVEITNLKSTKHLNGRRGFISKISQKNPLIFTVDIDDEQHEIENKNLLKVYCLGIPCEYKLSDDNDCFKFFLATLTLTNSSNFYVFAKHYGTKSSLFLVNIKFFDTVLQRMTTEPLLRIYGMKKSQNDKDCKILFNQYCIDPPNDMSYPWYVDLTTSKFLELVARFENIKDEKQLKNMNIQDFVV